MVKVTFYNLLRSKYGVKEQMVSKGTINDIINQILEVHPDINKTDFDTAVVFLDGKPYHKSGFHKFIDDQSEIIITHFVGGG